MTQLNTKTRI